MARWEPDAPGRLRRAALELFGERGFEQTTVEDIATRAGLTKRTFFRHYADKREVLFDGQEHFRAVFVETLTSAPADATPLEAVGAALEAAAAFFEDRREFARERQRVVAANAGLRERELVKLASVGSALAEALRARGVEEPEASLTAETAMAVFRIAFERWVGAADARPFADHVREGLDALRAVAATRS